MKIIFLDAFTSGLNELNIEELKTLGEFEVFDRTDSNVVIERSKSADILIVNKVKLGSFELDNLPNLKYIVVAATGYNNIDLETAKKRGILVSNVKNYSSFSVAQQVFALLLDIANQVQELNDPLEWSKQVDFSYYKTPLRELANKTLGLYGIGNIGNIVAKIAVALGMKVIATRKNLEKSSEIEIVSFNELIEKSDIISLHSPLTNENFEIFNKEVFLKMKKGAIIINTARGGLINENDLAQALKSGEIRAAGLDVLQQEPPNKNNELFKVKNLVVSPHVAWATLEARQRLMNTVTENIKAYKNGNPINLISA